MKGDSDILIDMISGQAWVVSAHEKIKANRPRWFGPFKSEDEAEAFKEKHDADHGNRKNATA